MNIFCDNFKMSCIKTERSNFIGSVSNPVFVFFLFFYIYSLNFISYDGNRVYLYTQSRLFWNNTYLFTFIYFSLQDIFS